MGKLLYSLKKRLINIGLFFENKKLLKMINSGLLSNNDSVDYNLKLEVSKRIIAAYKKTKIEQKNVEAVYLPGKEWGLRIEKYRKDLIEAVKADDYNNIIMLLDNFFRHSGLINGLTHHCYYSDLISGKNEFKIEIAKKIYNDFKTWNKEFDGKLNEIDLNISKIGNPWGLKIGQYLIPSIICSPNYISRKIIELISEISNPVICEIGGGVGLTGYYLQKKIRCAYLDLPEILILAQYYLMLSFPEKKFLLYGENNYKLLTFDLFRMYDFILLPNFELPKLIDNSINVLLNTYSLSEMDKETVAAYFKIINRVVTQYFYSENSNKAVSKFDVHIEIPVEDFPINLQRFERVYQKKAVWLGVDRYLEELYKIR